MLLTKNQFFLIAILLLLCIFFIHKVVWLLTAESAVGQVVMTGHGNLGSTLGLSSYQVVKFVAGSDTIVFNGEIDLGIPEGGKVNVFYQKDNPAEAKINHFHTLWSDSIIYSMWPLLVLLMFYFMPDIVPKKSKIYIGRKGFKVIPQKDR